MNDAPAMDSVTVSLSVLSGDAEQVPGPSK